MSRVGLDPISVPSGVQVEIKPDSVIVSGSNGKLQAPVFAGITVKQEGEVLNVARENDSIELKSKHGLVRALVANCVTGISTGFSRELVLQGVGYRAQKKGKQLVLSLGYSHDITFDEPEGITIEVPEPTKVKVSGIDKQQVGQVAAKIRAYRKPEPYKGKGVRYSDEQIRRKAGKAGKK